MAVHRDEQIPTTQLISQLVKDVRTLLRQEVALARAEIREELAKIIAIGAIAAIGIGTLAIAGLWMLIAMTRGLATMFGWPLAGVYAGVGAVLALIGIILLAIVWYQVRTVRVLPQTRETLSEHAHWTATHADQRA